MKRLRRIHNYLFKTKVCSGGVVSFYIAYTLIKFLRVIEKLFGKDTIPRKIKEGLRSKRYVIKNKVGTFCVNPGTDSLLKSSPLFEKQLQPWVTQTTTEGVFIDIGANVGFYTILALRQEDFTQAVSFEPSPEAFRLLQKNIELNGINAVAKNIALGDQAGTAKLKQNEYHTGGNKITTDNSKSDTARVSIDTLDQQMEKLQIQPGDISMIKIDVEGHELQCLKGMKETLDKTHKGTRLFVEILDNSSSAEKTQEIISNAGFKQVESYSENYLYEKQQ
jgi:FkbM family methyltransferase